ncbi:MAG TPA: hypothetical protein VFT22_02945 [Kofleriaceae bacterium]|nr:hypothetical protein [Kofleriaceae bacterium]
MRAAWIALAIAACHPAEPARPAAPKGPTACARASDNMVQLMLDRLSAKDAPPTEQADALRNLIRERCEQDGWSAEAIQCLYAMKRLEDAEPCAKLMTDAQQAALVRDQQARFGAAGSPRGSTDGTTSGATNGTTSGATSGPPTGAASEAPAGAAGAPPAGAASEPRP